MEEIKSKGKIYIIGDTHLSLNEKTNKNMDVFGGRWENYVIKLEKNWKAKITEEDVVILAGDISWGMTLEESLDDLKFLESLPGTKILLKGNHDYWWESKNKMDSFFDKNALKTFKILYNNSYNINGVNIFGSKGWSFEEEGDFKNLRREGMRLKLSGSSIEQETNKEQEQTNICITHYPPFLKNRDLEKIKKIENFKEEDLENIKYIDIMKKYNTKYCFYGHLHGESQKNAIEGIYEGIKFKLISGDYLDFDPFCITDYLSKEI